MANSGNIYRRLAAENQQKANQASFEAAFYKANGNNDKARSTADLANKYAKAASRYNSQALEKDLEDMNSKTSSDFLSYLPVEVQLRCISIIFCATACYVFFAFYLEADTVKSACITLALSVLFLLFIIKEIVKIFLYYRT